MIIIIISSSSLCSRIIWLLVKLVGFSVELNQLFTKRQGEGGSWKLNVSPCCCQGISGCCCAMQRWYQGIFCPKLLSAAAKSELWLCDPFAKALPATNQTCQRRADTFLEKPCKAAWPERLGKGLSVHLFCMILFLIDCICFVIIDHVTADTMKGWGLIYHLIFGGWFFTLGHFDILFRLKPWGLPEHKVLHQNPAVLRSYDI